MIAKGNTEIDNASAPASRWAEVEQCDCRLLVGTSILVVCDNVTLMTHIVK